MSRLKVRPGTETNITVSASTTTTTRGHSQDPMRMVKQVETAEDVPLSVKQPVADAIQESVATTIEQFLQSMERRAFHMARMATGSRDDALDIVQDAMFKLVEKYSANHASEWRPLFYRILNSKITDYYRRNAVKNRLISLASFGMKVGDNGADLIDRAAGRNTEGPEYGVARELQMKILSRAVAQLPGRQREAFMLRCWDGMSTALTAETMGCSEGSVKTHYSRAMHSLRASLEDYRYEEDFRYD